MSFDDSPIYLLSELSNAPLMNKNTVSMTYEYKLHNSLVSMWRFRETSRISMLIRWMKGFALCSFFRYVYQVKIRRSDKIERIRFEMTRKLISWKQNLALVPNLYAGPSFLAIRIQKIFQRLSKDISDSRLQHRRCKYVIWDDCLRNKPKPCVEIEPRFIQLLDELMCIGENKCMLNLLRMI